MFRAEEGYRGGRPGEVLRCTGEARYMHIHTTTLRGRGIGNSVVLGQLANQSHWAPVRPAVPTTSVTMSNQVDFQFSFLALFGRIRHHAGNI